MALKSYRNLTVWQKSMDLVVLIYQATRKLPAAERYGLYAQIRRCAVSIPSNVAEGYGRIHRGDYLHHLSIARGSLAELETQLLTTVRLEFVSREEAKPCWLLAQEVGKMLNKLIGSLDPRP